jgi:hypothetical protein
MDDAPALSTCVDIDPDGKGEDYVDVTIENHRYRQICCESCGYEITVPIYCGDRFCPVCSRPRLARVRRRLEFLIKHTPKETGYALKFLTLTVQSQPELPAMLRSITRAFRKLRQRAAWKRRVLGGAFVIECGYGVAGWHAHIHALVFARYFAFERLLKLWLSCSGGRGVFIKLIPPGAATNYLTKYLSKPATPESLTEIASDSLKGFRLFQPFGIWMKLLKDFHDTRPGCPNCGGHCWLPLDLVYKTNNSSLWSTDTS